MSETTERATEADRELLRAAGWHTYYHEDYWVHRDRVACHRCTDYTNWGARTAGALEIERGGTRRDSPARCLCGEPSRRLPFVPLCVRPAPWLKPTPDPLACYDCGLRYGEPGWMDATVPDDVWLRISPTGHGGGILCIGCMARRCEVLGLRDVPLQIGSGPFAP